MTTPKLPFEKISLADLVDHIHQFGTLNVEDTTCGFFLCEKGWARILLNGHELTLHQGDVFVYTPLSHLHPLEWSTDVSGVIAKSTLDVVLPSIMQGITPDEILNILQNPVFSLTPEEHERIRICTAVMDTKLQEIGTTASPTLAAILQKQLTHLAEVYIFELVICYLNKHERPTGTPDKRTTVFQTFITQLFKDYKRKRNVGYYADLQHLSPRYFSLLVKEESGRSVSEWINRIVISYARMALLHSDRSIKQIAQDFHFPDQSFFGKYFKQHTGMSPKDFRNRQET